MLFIPSSGRQTRSLRSNMNRTETGRFGKGCYKGGGFTICEHHNKQGCDVWCVTVSVTAAVGSFVTWRALQLLTWHREQLATAPSSLQQQENWGKCVLWWLHYSDYPQSAAVLCRYLLLLLPLSISGYWNEPGCLVKLKCPELSTSPPHCTYLLDSRTY